jgi:glycosyltransferase involved in cell wall biosynthesis
MGGIWLVLHLDAKKRGTMEHQLVAVARRLRDEGLPTTMVFARPPALFPGAELRELGVELRHLDYTLPAHSVAKQLWRWTNAERPWIVNFHFIDPYSPLVAAARLSGARVLIHDHIALKHGSALRSPFKLMRSLLLNDLFHERVAVSSFVAQTVRELHYVPAARVAVVENGVDTSRFESADGRWIQDELKLGKAPLIVSVARLDDEKGGEWLLRALPLVQREAQLAMVGEGPRLDAWRALSAKLGIADRVHFLGLRLDVERILAASSVVVCPSVCDEAFGLAVVEGMAAGKPLVVTDSGPMPEIMGGAGFVVPKRDPRALAEAIDTLLNNDLLRRKLGETGRLRARSLYGMDRFVEQLFSVYRRHLQANQAGTRQAPTENIARRDPVDSVPSSRAN